MKFFFALLATLFLATPAWAVDVNMGSGGTLVGSFHQQYAPTTQRHRRRSPRVRS